MSAREYLYPRVLLACVALTCKGVLVPPRFACLRSYNVQGIAAVPKANRRLPADDWSEAKAGAAESPVP